MKGVPPHFFYRACSFESLSPTRKGTAVARCTVERLMRRQGIRGVMRGKMVRTTISDTKAPCPLDRVNRQFCAERPNQLWVSDFTYVSTWQGWLYVAFVIDVFADASLAGA
jgi:putative transposase